MTSASCIQAQHADVPFLRDSSFSTADSISIFSLIDSLIALQEQQSTSQLAARLSYNSNVLSAGRTLGIENFGLSPGLSYFHRSGLYADVTSFWSKDFEPSYYLTIFSAGYMKDLSQKFSVAAGYDRYVYNLGEDAYVPYRNTLSITPAFDVRPFSLSANYAFYFGDQQAHRVMPGISVTPLRKKFWKFDRVSIAPAFYVLWGTEKVTSIEYVPPTTLRELLQNVRDYGTRYKTVIHEKNVSGIMNYAMSVPLTVSYGNWAFTFNYIYNIPKALPGEPETLSNSTYLTGSIMYLIDLASLK